MNADILVLRFPAPDTPLSENRAKGMHWAQRRRLLDPWGTWVRLEWNKARREPEGKAVMGRLAVVQIWLPVLDRRRRDPHNYVGTVVKVIVDALVDNYETVPPGRRVLTYEGIWPDDTPQWVTVREPRLYVGKDCVVEILPKLDGEPGEPPQATI